MNGRDNCHCNAQLIHGQIKLLWWPTRAVALLFGFYSAIRLLLFWRDPGKIVAMCPFLFSNGHLKFMNSWDNSYSGDVFITEWRLHQALSERAMSGPSASGCLIYQSDFAGISFVLAEVDRCKKRCRNRIYATSSISPNLDCPSCLSERASEWTSALNSRSRSLGRSVGRSAEPFCLDWFTASSKFGCGNGSRLNDWGILELPDRSIHRCLMISVLVSVDVVRVDGEQEGDVVDHGGAQDEERVALLLSHYLHRTKQLMLWGKCCWT